MKKNARGNIAYWVDDWKEGRLKKTLSSLEEVDFSKPLKLEVETKEEVSKTQQMSRWDQGLHTTSVFTPKDSSLGQANDNLFKVTASSLGQIHAAALYILNTLLS